MDTLLATANRLQDVFSKCDMAGVEVNLPQIVVVGAQSSGKSSVLESIVGLGFLPRGTGVVTRRPIVMQMHHIRNQDKPYVEFAHMPGKRYTNMDEVRDEIQMDTNRVAKDEKNIKPTPLNLSIYSPDAPNLTLIDLPGLTKIPIGDQPQDVGELVRRLVYKFIRPVNSLILAVHAANADLATCEALEIARDVDPEGKRTIGVVTKIDLMDEGTDAYDVLTNRTFPLQHGYVGVVNRSQANIERNVSMEQARNAEEEFFAVHPKYAPIASKHGTRYLTQTLSCLLKDHIRNCLPGIREQITSKLEEIRVQLGKLGWEELDARFGVGTGSASLMISEADRLALEAELGGGKGLSSVVNGTEPLQTRRPNVEKHHTTKLLHYITDFASRFGHFIDGDASSAMRTTEFTLSGMSGGHFERGEHGRASRVGGELVGGARIQCLCFDKYVEQLSEMGTQDTLTFEDMRVAIRNASGARSSLFIPENAFVSLASSLVRRFLRPSLECVDKVHEELLKLVQLCTQEPSVARYPKLCEALLESSRQLLYLHKQGTVRMVKSLVHIHASHVNTKSAEFLKEFGSRGLTLGFSADDALAPASSASYQSAGPGSRSIGSSYAAAAATPSLSHLPASHHDQQYAKPMMNGTGPPPSAAATARERSGPDTTRQELQELRLIQSALECYFELVKSALQDTVPKSIMAFLVHTTRECVQGELVKALFQEYDTAGLMAENPMVAKQREALLKLRESFLEGLDVLNELKFGMHSLDGVHNAHQASV
ncbi:Dynamin-1-like protein [Porphyridium purpureum]|uniref:Dynamin-1-like protein n=1 Tax=Porphyridium purpureum TaxID=35688 RepID=A0A5J4Z0U5_PORPP|nr:Dynamin-1-like protein [Porphyridium purpureum]|eukprot:POR1451..scf208_2